MDVNDISVYAKFKVSVFGDGGVGKSTLVARYLTGTFKKDLSFTIGVDFHIKTVNIDGKQIILQLWDFGGEKRFRFLLPTYVSGSSGAIFMFDITRYSSIKNLSIWLDVFKKGVREHVPLIIVGGKSDLEFKRSVSKEEAIEIAKKYNFSHYIECSSKTGEHVEDIFERITRLMMEKARLL